MKINSESDDNVTLSHTRESQKSMCRISTEDIQVTA